MSPTRTPASADGPDTFPTTILPEACIASQRSAAQRIASQRSAVAQSVAADLVRIQAKPDLRLGKRDRVAPIRCRSLRLHPSARTACIAGRTMARCVARDGVPRCARGVVLEECARAR
jgi:hypothetical protein